MLLLTVEVRSLSILPCYWPQQLARLFCPYIKKCKSVVLLPVPEFIRERNRRWVGLGWVGMGWVGGDFCVVGLVWCFFGWLYFRHHHQRPWASRPVPVASSLAGGFCADLLRWQFHSTLSKPRQSVSFWNHSYMSFISFASCSLSCSC